MDKEVGYRYAPSEPPRTDSAEEIKRWALQELQNAANVINNLAEGRCAVAHVEPRKPRDGMIRMADGEDWNPGDGRGYYGFDSGSGLWLPLGVVEA